tara:strand:+ start:49 stop:567 length:519 start_codon:yes stop_codon:yes gene_type:complete
MIIQGPELESIKNRKITFVKNFIQLKTNYDFNYISKLLEENDTLQSWYRPAKSGGPVLEKNFHIERVGDLSLELYSIFNYFKKIIKYSDHFKDNVDLFFSFVPSVGNTHDDEEDVYIVGLHGKTMYQIYGENKIDYIINKGDLIFIPKGNKHRSIALSPRIIASIGFYGSCL